MSKTKKNLHKTKNTSRKNGGRRFGSGFKGSVIDLCNSNKHDIYNLCKQLHPINIKNVKIYLKKPGKQFQNFLLESQEEIQDFIRFVKSSKTKNYVVKEFYNYKIKEIDFQNEIQSYETISKIISKEENLLGIPYINPEELLIGFEVNYKDTISQVFKNELYSILQNNPIFGISDIIHEKINKRLFVVNRKCQKTMNTKSVKQFSVDTFKKFVIQILEMIIKLNKINVAHGDIKLDNIMLCSGSYKLIDWEQSRKLDYNSIKLNLAMGSCPVYYIIKFGGTWEYIHTAAIPFIIKYTGCNDRDSKISSKYIFDGIEYYKSIFENQDQYYAFEKVKHSMDLYSFGLILYGILEHNAHVNYSSKYEKYRDFVNKIYKYDNPSKALADFQSI